MGFDRYIPVLQELKQGEKSVSKRDLQEELRKIWEAVHVLEGRSGPINLLDSVTINGDLDVTGDISGKSIVASDTFEMTERQFDSSQSLAPDPAPTGSGRIYLDQISDRFKVSENFRAYQDLVMYEQARVYSSIDQSLTSGALTNLTFDTVRWDTDSMFDPLSPTILTIQHAGNYIVGGVASFDGNATGIRRVRIFSNATPIAASVSEPDASAAPVFITVETSWQFSVGDQITMEGFQSSGGPLNVLSVVADSCELWVVRVQ